MQHNKSKLSHKIILPVLLAGMVSSTVVMAKPFGAERGHHMEQRLEHMIDYLELREEQAGCLTDNGRNILLYSNVKILFHCIHV